MAKDSSLFTWLDEAKERKIYVSDDFDLYVVGQGDVTYRHGKIFNTYHVPNLNANLFLLLSLHKFVISLNSGQINSMFMI
jgi:hypothetical protein